MGCPDFIVLNVQRSPFFCADTFKKGPCLSFYLFSPLPLQGWAKRRTPGLENFDPAVAYHFCLNLPEKYSQPGDYFLAQPCISPTLHAAIRLVSARPTDSLFLSRPHSSSNGAYII